MGIPRGSGLQAWSHSLPRSPMNQNRKAGVAPLPRPYAVRDSGLWGKAHTPCKVTGTGQGKCSWPWAGRCRKAHPGILCKPGHRGMEGRGRSTQDTTPRARRKKKTILTHRGDTFCGDGIQAAARQGGVQTAAIGRWGTEGDTRKKRQKTSSVPTLHSTPYHVTESAQS